ncbi:MAG: phosphoribosylaminoimidazolesuccinocarboxamide synthase [Bifidobacteriaceae bacterium]|nr:phosphoribosylaminoimidazolesuccinocarboxamide synthase [Bifidobacteriaceae bacterium]
MTVVDVTGSTHLQLDGWQYVTSGKVRDIYEPSVQSPFTDVILVVTSDKISAYDYVLPTTIPDKGKVLTALSVWWFEQLQDLVPNHLVSLDVPPEVEGRAMVCQRLTMYPVECVARGYLTGSGLAEYQQSGQVTGIPLPPGLQDGDRLPNAIFTPATKAELGDHDENVPFSYVADQLGNQTAEKLRQVTLDLYQRAEQIARERGLILADTKFEFGVEATDGRLTLGDEVLTPDSSRYWDAKTWQPGGPQPSFDKQYLRDWLTHESGWDRESTPPELPAEVVEKTRDRYIAAYERLTGQTFNA